MTVDISAVPIACLSRLMCLAEYTDGKVLGYNEGIKMVSSDGKVLGAVLGNVYGITLGIDVGTGLGSLDGYLDAFNDGLREGCTCCRSRGISCHWFSYYLQVHRDGRH